MLWEVSRLRKIVLQTHELDILLTDDRILSRDAQLVKVARALRMMLEAKPVIAEYLEKTDTQKRRKVGFRI